MRLGLSIGILFLLLYFVVDLTIRRAESRELHLVIIVGTAVFLFATWTRWFVRFWKFFTLLACIFIMAMFVAISATTGDPESRLIVVILCPVATSSFVSWGPRWQLAVSAASLAAYGFAQKFIPIEDGYNTYRTLGLFAALLLAESTSIFIEQYRNRIRGQLDALEAAARFREREIATMAHDIKNPISALAGYIELLEEPSISQADRDQMIARIGSTAWNTNLVVSNALDLYRMEEDGRFHIPDAETNPNPVLADVAEDCAAQARRVGIKWRYDLADLPHARIDAQYLARIVRNLAAVPLGVACSGQVSLSASLCGERIAIEVDAPGARISAADLDKMMVNPRTSGRAPGAGKIGLFLARSIAEAAGGTLAIRTSNPTGINLRAEIPCLTPIPTEATQTARRSA